MDIMRITDVTRTLHLLKSAFPWWLTQSSCGLLVFPKKKKKTLQINGHKRSKIVLSIKTGDKLGGSLKKDASYWIFVLFYFLNFNIYRLMMCLKSVQIYTPL